MTFSLSFLRFLPDTWHSSVSPPEPAADLTTEQARAEAARIKVRMQFCREHGRSTLSPIIPVTKEQRDELAAVDAPLAKAVLAGIDHTFARLKELHPEEKDYNTVYLHVYCSVDTPKAPVDLNGIDRNPVIAQMEADAVELLHNLSIYRRSLL